MSVKVEFLGATDTVTGSRTLVTYHNKTWLVDCGLFQGHNDIRDRNWEPFPVARGKLAGVVLTHAHLDHSGFLPRLWREGHHPKILCTAGTAELCHTLLLDAAKLEEESAAYANVTGYSYHKPADPLFTTSDAESVLKLFETAPRDKWVPLDESVSVRFLRAGHIIGASMVQFLFEGEAGGRILTFSGDLGNERSNIMKGPTALLETDALILESTYGDRLQPRSPALTALAEIANRTFARGGVLVVPAFAVGRAQEVTYMLRLLEDQGAIPKVPVLLDSPMASAAASVFLRHPEDQIVSFGNGHGNSNDGGDAAQKLEDGKASFQPSRYEVITSADESMLACMRDGPMTVISASGMLNGGRILHHLKARLPHKRNTVMFTGYQAEGTKGRFLQDFHTIAGNPEFRIHHQIVAVEAEVVTLDQLSSHADYEDILKWMEQSPQPPPQVFVNHGEPAAQAALATRIREKFGVDARPTSAETKISLFANDR